MKFEKKNKKRSPIQKNELFLIKHIACIAFALVMSLFTVSEPETDQPTHVLRVPRPHVTRISEKWKKTEVQKPVQSQIDFGPKEGGLF